MPSDDSPRAYGGATAAVGLAFILAGTTMASWFARVPAVKSGFALGDGAMGALLVCVAIGSLIAMPIAGGLIARVGGRRVFITAEIALCFALGLPAIAPTVGALAVSLVLLGGAHGLLDVSMNSQASGLEQAANRPLMPVLHALFSIGGFAGAAFGALMAHWQVPLAIHLGAVALAFVLLAVPAYRFMPADAAPGGLAPSQAPSSIFALPDRALAGLALIAFCSLMAEGAINDWSAIYLAQSLETGPGFAPLGYAVFSVAMVAGRLAGGPLNVRVSASKLVGGGGVLAAVGVALCVIAPGRATALAGFSLIGLGLATVFPLVVSTAGRRDDRPASKAVAAVSTAGFAGFLVGPAIIGGLASLFSLRAALAVLILLCAVIAWLSLRRYAMTTTTARA